MSHSNKAYGWTIALALAGAACVVGPSFADRKPTKNESQQKGKLFVTPLTDFLFEATTLSTKQAGDVLKLRDVLGRFQVGVTRTARLKVDTLPRPGAYPQSVPAGTTLFQVSLDNGVGFCAPLLPNQGVRQTQCFRDLNDDGTFDAGYVTGTVDRAAHIYSARLRGLSPIPQTPYELTEGTLIPSEETELVVGSISGNIIRFDYRFNGVKLTETECEIQSDTPCRILNQEFLFEPLKGGVRIRARAEVSAS